VIEVACTIAPLCGMDLLNLLWLLPAAVAYQIFYLSLQLRGFALTCGPTEQELLARMKRWQM
jgi:hypothetical protein